MPLDLKRENADSWRIRRCRDSTGLGFWKIRPAVSFLMQLHGLGRGCRPFKAPRASIVTITKNLKKLYRPKLRNASVDRGLSNDVIVLESSKLSSISIIRIS